MNKSLVKAYFIDPYRCQATLLLIADDIRAWHKALRCDCLDAGYVRGALPDGHVICIWVDDLGQCQPRPLATFQIGETTYHGYGLITEADRMGATCSISFSDKFLVRLGLMFEEWEKRLDPADYLEEMTRVIEWEDWYVKPTK